MNKRTLKDSYFMSLVGTGNFDGWKIENVMEIAERMADAYQEGYEAAEGEIKNVSN